MSDMTLALQVLSKLPMKKLMSKRKDGDSNYYIYPYSNGREKGLLILHHQSNKSLDDCHCVEFSEHRSSDSLYFISGKASEFDIWNNGSTCIVNSEKKYQKDRKYFNPDEIFTKGIKQIKKELKL